MPYNEAPVVNGSEPNHSRVELLRDWMSSYRPDRLGESTTDTPMIVEEMLDGSDPGTG
jgi:hypothetical protein